MKLDFVHGCFQIFLFFSRSYFRPTFWSRFLFLYFGFFCRFHQHFPFEFLCLPCRIFGSAFVCLVDWFLNGRAPFLNHTNIYIFKGICHTLHSRLSRSEPTHPVQTNSSKNTINAAYKMFRRSPIDSNIRDSRSTTWYSISSFGAPYNPDYADLRNSTGQGPSSQLPQGGGPSFYEFMRFRWFGY